MGESWWVAGATVILVAAFLLWKWIPARNGRRVARFAEARRDFHLQRERLEAKFVQLGLARARPGVPQWIDCEFDDDVAYARNRVTGELTAFVGVAIELESPLPHSMEIMLGAGHHLAATAVFRLDHDHWDTDGRAIFNLTPTEAIRHYQRDLELLGREVAQRR